MPKQIDEHYINGLLHKLEEYNGPAHENMDLVHDAHKLIYHIKRPAGVPVHIPSTSASVVQASVNHIVTANILFEAPPLSASRDHFLLSEKQQKVYHSLLARANRKMASDFFRGLAFGGVLPGAFAAKVSVDTELLNSEPILDDFDSDEEYRIARDLWQQGASMDCPFIPKALDPRNVFPPPNFTYPMKYCIERQKRHVVDLEEKYPHWSDPKGKRLFGRNDEQKRNPLREVEWIEYWDRDTYAVLADGEFAVGPMPNPYGFVPYIYGYSGLGYGDAPEDKAVGVLHFALSELESQARVRTAMDAQWQYFTFAMMGTTEDAQAIKNQMSGPGSVIGGLQGKDSVWYLEPPKPPAHLQQFDAIVQASIQENTRASTLSGGATPGAESGYQHALYIGQSRMKLQPIIDSVQLHAGVLFGYMARLLETYLKTPITIDAGLWDGKRVETMRPEEWKGHYTVFVKMESADPIENDRLQLTGLQLLQAGTISRYMFLKEYKKDKAPMETLKILLAEKILDLPEVLMMLGRQFIREIGTEEEIAAIEAQEAQERQAIAIPTQSGQGGGREQVPRMATAGPGEFQEQRIRKQQLLGAPGQGGASDSRPTTGRLTRG